MAAELPELIVPDAEDWRSWLGEHHDDSPGVWLVLAKRRTTEPTTLTYEQALEEAICHGWIDGQVGRRDGATYRQRFTPRQQRGSWSRTNVELAQRLVSQGRMRPPGQAAVDHAKANGHWKATQADRQARRAPSTQVGRQH